MKPTIKQVGRRAMRMVLMAGMVAAQIAAAGSSQSVAAQKQKYTDKDVKAMMTNAFRAMPDHIKKGDRVIKIDKDKPENVLIPLKDARRIMKSAGVSAMAQLCKRDDLLLNHRNVIMLEEKLSKKWSDQQLEYINRLHMLRVMDILAQTGKSEDEAKKKSAALSKKLCSDQIAKQLETKIKAKWDAVKKK